jgi:predicted dehydrogenase
MTLSVAIAGCGYFSRFHQDAWSRMEGVHVVGVADRDPAGGRGRTLSAGAGLH